MRDGAREHDGWGWAVRLLIRFLCSRRGAVAGRAAILTCAFILISTIALAVWKGPSLVNLVWDRFTNMEQSIAAIQKDLHEYQLGANYRTLARDRQVVEIEQDVDKLQASDIDHERRLIRLEARAR